MEHGDKGDKNVILKASISPSSSDTKKVNWSISDEDKHYAELDTSIGNNAVILKPKNDVGNITEKIITVIAEADDNSKVQKKIHVTIKNPKISAQSIS